MRDQKLAEHLDFLTAERGQEEATILVEALRAGVEALYREALTEAYLPSRVPRETALAELGQEALESIEYQRDALRRDVEWATKSA